MKVAQFYDRSTARVGILQGREWIDYAKAQRAMGVLTDETIGGPHATIEDLLTTGGFDVRRFRTVLQFVKAHRLETYVRIPPGMRLGAPLRAPRKIIALGLNYVLHAREGHFPVPEHPIMFVKAGSSVIGPDEVVRLPRGMGRMDHEVELALVIGRTAREVRRRSAWGYVAGYTICNDISARDLQTQDLEKKHPWFRSKSFDTFTPLGPWIVTADELPPPLHLNLACRVNGRLRQKANTRDLVFDIPALIEFVSRYITLEAGDVISTGTPAGIGPIRGGDLMVCSIEGIGELRNPVRWR